MEDFGAIEQAEAEAEAEAAASNHKPEISRGGRPMQEKQKQSPDDSKQQVEASSSKPERRGPKPKLTKDERHTNKLESCRRYRKKKADEKKTLQEKCKNLEILIATLKKEAQQSEMNTLKEHSEGNAQADKLVREVSDESKIVNVVKRVNEAQKTEMQQLQEKFLKQDNQEHDAENSEFNIPMDDEELSDFFLEGMEDFSAYLNSKWNKTKEGPSIGEVSSIAKVISPLHETANVRGFSVPKENSDVIQEIFSRFPDTASGIRFRYPASRNGFINTLAEVYKMVTREEVHNQEEISHMVDGIEDLDRAGFEISWLKDLVGKCREEFEVEEEIRLAKDKLKRLEERQSKRAEERKSKRQRPM